MEGHVAISELPPLESKSKFIELSTTLFFCERKFCALLVEMTCRFIDNVPDQQKGMSFLH